MTTGGERLHFTPWGGTMMLRKWLILLNGLCSSEACDSEQALDQPQSGNTTIVLEIPDALDPEAADRKYSEAIHDLLTRHELGSIAEIRQGEANTPDEFTRIIRLDLSDLDRGMQAITDLLMEQEAPAGTFATLIDAAGNPVEQWMLVP